MMTHSSAMHLADVTLDVCTHAFFVFPACYAN